MYLHDIYTFITVSYTKKSPELLMIWLSKFPYYDRILFINFFILNKLKFTWRHCSFDTNYKTLHVPNCICQTIFDESLKSLMCERTSEVWFLKKCIGTGGKKAIEPVKTVSFKIDHAMNVTPKKIRFNNSSREGSNFNNIFKIDTQNFGLDGINPKDVNVSLRIFEKYQQQFNRLEKIVHLIDVKELTVLLYPFMPAINIFDMLLPEYMRISGMRNRFRSFDTNAETILVNIYNFFNGDNIQQTNSNKKMTSILPRINYIMNPLPDTNNEYFYQPRLAGIRVFICKTVQNNILVMNKNHIKINIQCPSITNLKNDLINTYSGEFIIILENIETELFMSKKYLLKYLSNTMVDKRMYRVKLVLLDLHSWQKVNLLVKPYSDRYNLFDSFINYVKHDDSIIKIKNYTQTAMIYDHFNRYLNTTALDSTLNGIVYRNKSCVYETKLQAINFNNQFQKHIIVSKYNTFQRILHNQNIEETIYLGSQIPFSILSPNSSDKIIHSICYEIEKNIMKLAMFDKNEYKPFCNILTDQSTNPFLALMKHSSPIKINGITYSWIIVKIGISSSDSKTLTSLEFCPEKTLFDMSPWFSL
nr:hypothetical protein MmNV_28 [Menippe mercenaria nudivirus]